MYLMWKKPNCWWRTWEDMTPSWNMKCDPCSVICEGGNFFSFLILFDWHESDDILYLHAVFLPSRRPLFLLDTHNMRTHLSISFFLLLRLSPCDRKHMLQLFPVSGQTLAFDSRTHRNTDTALHPWPCFHLRIILPTLLCHLYIHLLNTV